MIPDGYTCNFCGSGGFRFLFEARDLNREASAESFSICECSGCGLVITWPQPEDLSRYYPEPYYHTGKPFDPARNLQKNERVLAKLKRYCPGGRFLDVGCNVGSLVRAAADSGYSASGIDISEGAVSYAREVLGVEAHCGDFIRYPFPEDVFDVITLSHVLEHTKDPAGTLAKAYRSLRQGGVLFLAVPDFGSPQAQLFRQRWFHLDVPRHLHHFRKHVLMPVLMNIGYRIEGLEQGPVHFDQTGFRGSVVNLVPVVSLKRAVKKIAPFLGYPFIALGRRGQQAASFEIIARKHDG